MEANEQQVVSLKSEATGLAQWAENLSIVTVSDANEAMSRLAVVKGMRKKVVDWFAPMKTAAAAAHKAIVAREKEITDVADKAEVIAKQKVLAFQQAERAKAEAEQRRLQAEADEAARKERERLEKEAAKLKTPELREARLEAAAAVVAPVVAVVAPVATAAGTSTRKTWRAVIVDKTALIAAASGNETAASLLAFDQKAADALARATKGTIKIPGVRWQEDESLSVRSLL